MLPEPLKFEELVALDRVTEKGLFYLYELYGLNHAILSPGEIPIHPVVYAASQAYSLDFVNHVRASMPDALQEDIATIDRLLGVKLGITVDDDSIRGREGLYTLHINDERDIGLIVDEGRRVQLGRGSTGVWLNINEPGELSVWKGHHGVDHPMTTDRLRAYGAKGESLLHVPVWHIGNLKDQGEPVYHYIRTFAVQFNNLGLQEFAH